MLFLRSPATRRGWSVLVAPDFEADARAAIRALVEEGACAETGPPAGFDGDWLGPEEGD